MGNPFPIADFKRLQRIAREQIAEKQGDTSIGSVAAAMNIAPIDVKSIIDEF